MMRHNNKLISEHVAREEYGPDRSGSTFDPDAVRFCNPSISGYGGMLMSALIAQAVQDVELFFNPPIPRKYDNDSVSREWNRMDKRRQILIDAWFADRWLRGETWGGDVMQRFSFSDCCNFMGLHEPDLRRRIYDVFDRKGYDLLTLRTIEALDTVRDRLNCQMADIYGDSSPKVRNDYMWRRAFAQPRTELVRGIDFSVQATPNSIAKRGKGMAKRYGVDAMFEVVGDRVIVTVRQE